MTMSRSQIIRAWKDEEYRRSLSAAERALLPRHPAGCVEDLTDAELGAVVGGGMPHSFRTEIAQHCGPRGF
jgi:mersacidin/lichenicidin family type 2 lantibiotic